jgi:hypothetical protein
MAFKPTLCLSWSYLPHPPVLEALKPILAHVGGEVIVAYLFSYNYA